MKREKFLELAQLYLMNELDNEKRIEVENIILENDEFSREFDSLKQFYEAFQSNRPPETDERLLVSARNELMRSIRNEAAKEPAENKILAWLKNIFVVNYKISFGSLTLLFIGVFVGYFLFYSSNNLPVATNTQSVDLDNIESYETRISNIKIPNPFFEGGEIEVLFGGVGGTSPISYKGRPDDPVIQRALATALVTQENPGLKLRTVNTIATQIEQEQFIPDPKVKEALITALKTDDNPAVRREALNVLQKFPFDPEVRDAYLFVLSNDTNSGLRVSAINALANLKVQGNSLDEKVINVLNRKAESDQSDFIRLRAASLIKEVN
ncbi:MAG TPA: HEAT repeat domain-containing protein [Melioribacteraceae bacterium]|nr:HEAT repeat domain-containing protein [Melioribacteraceae bacterium]